MTNVKENVGRLTGVGPSPFYPTFIMRISSFVIPALLGAAPATQPTTGLTIDQRIDQLLAPPPVIGSAPTPRRSGPPRATAVRAVGLVREGTALSNQLARLGHTADGKHAVLTFTPEPPAAGVAAVAYPPMVVLPDLELDAMERQQSADGGGAAAFRVWGVVTEYKGRNYVRVDRAAGTDADGRAVARTGEVGIADRTGGRAAVAPGSPAVTLARDGRRFADRAGRLNVSADGATDTLTFDVDARTMRDPPMILLPNRVLADMEGQRAGLTKDAKFRCSGTVTEYRGRNYVLLEKAVASQDFDAEF